MDIDLNMLRSAATVLSLVVFLALVWRVWSRKQREELDEAAKLPFLDSAPAPETPNRH